MDLLAQLNPAQRQAAQHVDGPVLVLAGAGSGKTRVLTSRIAHLIRDHHVAPNHILAVTFTNKAAQEMRERVVNIVGSVAQVIWLSTFHSTCLRILRRHAVEIGYENAFVIYDDTDQKTLLKQIIQDLQYNERAFAPQAVQWAINSAKNDQMTPDIYEQQPLNFFQERVAVIYRRYQAALLKNNAMDFADLINQAIRLFEEKPDVLRLYQRTFKYVMVDEYQDTNPSQYRLLSLITDRDNPDAAHNLFVVGDEDQSIYGWRGADIKIILKFEEDFPGAAVYRLEQNYRSTQVILSAANHVVSHNTERKGKTLWTDKKGGALITYATSLDEHDEGAYVVRSISDLKGKGVIDSYSEAAVFYRTNAQSRVLEDELRKRDIPYKIIGGTRFYDRAEIKDVLAYLHVLVNPQDSIHLLRIINKPARGIGNTTVDKLLDLAQEKNISLYAALSDIPESVDLNAGVRKKIAGFTEMLRKMRVVAEGNSVADTVRQVIELSEYARALEEESTIEAESRLENIGELVTGIEEYEERFRPDDEHPAPSLPDFLDRVALVADSDQIDLSAGAVNLMTIHLAKGLEFPAVFVTGMEEGLFPHSRSLSEESGVEEERRLCYVGMTRAKERLFLTNTARRRLYGADYQYNVASRFCEEIPDELLTWVNLLPANEGYAPSRSKSFTFQGDGSGETIDYSESQESGYNDDDQVDDSMPFRVGMQVRHAQFGVGVVRKTEGHAQNAKVIVQFQGVGPKKLLIRIANLEVIR